MNGKYKELGKNTLIFAISLFLSKLVSSLMVPLYTRTLTTEQYGIADLIMTLSQFIVPICSLSIHEAVFRFSLDKKNNKHEIIRCGMNIAWIASILMCITGVLSRLYSPIEDWIVYLVVISILTMFHNILSLYTEASGKVKLFGVDSVVCNFVLGASSVVFLLFCSLEIRGYFYAVIVSQLTSIILLKSLGHVSIRPKFQRGDMAKIKPMLLYSAPLVLNSISWILMSMVDRVMLTSMFSSASSGVYAVALKIPTLLTILTSVFTQAWGLSLVKDYDTDRDEEFYNNIFDIFHLIVLIGTSGILLFTNNVFAFIIGDEFIEAVKYIAVLMIGTVFLTYTSFYSPVYSATKKSSKIAISSFAGLLINLVLNIILIPRIGIMGACISTTGSYILICVYRMIDCRKYVSLKFNKIKWIISMLLILIQSFFVTINKFDIIVSVVVLILICLMYCSQLIRVSRLVVNKIRDYGRIKKS